MNPRACWRAAIAGVAFTAGAAACTSHGSSGTYAEPASAIASTNGFGDARQGRILMANYGCGACHNIPGVHGARGRVGPPLDDFSQRTYIAGELPNSAENLVRWIRSPQSVEPGTAMPALGVSEDDARSMAAYLYTLR